MCRVHAQEDDGIFVFVDDVMVGEGRVPRQDSANETGTSPDPSHIGVQVGLVTFEHYLPGAKVLGWFVQGDISTIIYRNADSFKPTTSFHRARSVWRSSFPLSRE